MRLFYPAHPPPPPPPPSSFKIHPYIQYEATIRNYTIRMYIRIKQFHAYPNYAHHCVLWLRGRVVVVAVDVVVVFSWKEKTMMNEQVGRDAEDTLRQCTIIRTNVI